MRAQELSEDAIAALVDVFYRKVHADAVLGPIFSTSIRKEDWPAHLSTMVAFWSSVMMTTGRYKGNPMQAHLHLEGVWPEDFTRWLALFYESSAEVFDDALAAGFRLKAGRIARSLAMGMFPLTPPPASGGATPNAAAS